MERTIQYLRHEFRHKPQTKEAKFSAFVYDVPYLDACGIFPPLHILNITLRSGGGDGGMGPGASWKPFEITKQEYEHVLPKILHPNLTELQKHGIFAWVPMQIDLDFDYIQDRFEWAQAVCNRHRDQWHQIHAQIAQIVNHESSAIDD